VGKGGCPACSFYQVLYFALGILKHKAPAFIGHSFRKRNFVGRRGSGTKTLDAQCASAHVAMAAVVSFISIWLPLHERTGLSVSPLARPLLVCIQISILGEQERRKETMAVYFLKPLFRRMVVAGRSYGRGRAVGGGPERAGEEIIETKFMVGVAYGRHVEAIISCGPEADRHNLYAVEDQVLLLDIHLADRCQG
jgi:hypothetical protein